MLNILFFLGSYQQRNDDEAVVDRGGSRSQQGTIFGEEDLEGTWTALNAPGI